MSKRPRLVGDPVSLEELLAGPVWAVPAASFAKRAHRFRVREGIITVRCQITLRLRRVYAPGVLLHAGDFPHCKMCEAHAARR